jgi:valyl-tRNA synthetase
MVMLGLRFVGKIPFKTVFITPLVFDIAGRKMSKSLGNAIDPLVLAAKYGADAFRLGTMMQMRLESQELRFDERVCDQAKRFNSKLWNALHYIVGLAEGLPAAAVLPTDRLTLADKWVLTELQSCVSRVTGALDSFAMGTAANALHDFGWYKFCDWYLESTKIDAQKATRAPVLSFVLNALVRALHPLEPFVTEEIWQALPHDGETIVTASWPDPSDIPTFSAEAAVFEAVIGCVVRIRNAKAELELRPNDTVRLRTAPLPSEIVALFSALVRGNVVIEVDLARSADAPLETTLAQIDVLADPAVLRERYTRRAAKLEEEVARLERKLANPDFIAKAKPELVEAERAKLADYQREQERIRTILRDLPPETQ